MAQQSTSCPADRRRFLPRKTLDLASCNFLLLCGVALLTVFWFRAGPHVGDGTHYYLMLISLAENLTPYSTDRTGAIYDAHITTSPYGQRFMPYSEVRARQHQFLGTPQQIEFDHFWFYSLLAALYYWPLKCLGLDIGLSFNLLHVSLMFLAAYVANRQLGPLAALSLILLVVFSPALWFINKAHTEFFTVMTTTLAMVCFLTRKYVVSAIWFAVASTQNPPFGVLALIGLGWGFGQQKWHFLTRHKLALSAAVALMGIHPLYYLIKYRTLTPTILTGHGKLAGNLLPVKHLAALWVDPDLGMFANWWLALPIVVLFVLLCGKGIVRLRPDAILLGALSILVLGWAITRIGNVNHGGTVSISRYCLWFLFLFFAMQWRILDWLATRRRLVLCTLAGAALAPALCTLWQYRPGIREFWDRPTAVSLLLYEHVPGLYDPLSEVFLERYGGGEDSTAWAVSHPSGNKILVWDEDVDFNKPQEAPPVVGCPELDPAAVCRAAKQRFAQRPGAYFVYLNGLGSALKRPAKLPRR